MTSRREARRLALDALFQADVTRSEGPSVLASWGETGRRIPAYTRELVEGVTADLVELDEAIGTVAEGWSVERMPALDRTILRVAAYELSVAEVPVGAVIDEAVRAAKELSTEDSARFVNGVLGQIARTSAAADDSG